MSQYPVPQFIEEEGKIIYFLTYRQFFILVGGGGAIIVLYWTIPWTPLFIASVIFVAMLSGIIAFLKIGNYSALTFALNMAGFALRTKTYTWKKKEFNYSFKEKSQVPIPEKEEQTVKPMTLAMQPSKLRGIQKLVDTKK